MEQEQEQEQEVDDAFYLAAQEKGSLFLEALPSSRADRHVGETGVEEEEKRSHRCCSCKWGTILRISLLLFGLGVCVAGFITCTVTGYTGVLLRHVAKLGIWGRVIFVVAFVVVAFPFVTGYVVLALGSGFLYGIWQATLIMVVGANIGACLAFFACRKLLRGWTLRQVRKSAKLSAIFDALGENGLKIAFLIRFVPVPFGLQNMVLASSAAIPFWRFMLGTALGLLPEQVAGAYFGKTARKLSDIIDGKMELGTTQKVLLGVDAAMVVLLIVVIVYVGRRALKTLSTRQQNNASRAPTLNSGDEELEGLLSSAKNEEDELLLGLSSSSDTEAEEAASQDSAVRAGGDPFSFDRFGNAPLVPELASGDGNIPDIL